MHRSAYSTSTHRILVDSGHIWIGDPCYILPDRTRGEDKPGLDYSDLMEIEAYMGWPSCAEIKDKDGHHLGVISGTGYGDGEYQVELVKNREGRVVQVIIDFDPEELCACGETPEYCVCDEEEEED